MLLLFLYLPQAQKSDPVKLPLGSKAPVVVDESDQTGMEGLQPYTIAGSGVLGAFNVTDTSTTPPTTITQGSGKYVTLAADLSEAVGTTINQLRQAYAIQKFYENDAMNGTRYIELVKGHFNVTNPDFRVQRSEYLGGKRIPININSLYAGQQTTEGLVPTYTDPDNPS